MRHVGSFSFENEASTTSQLHPLEVECTCSTWRGGANTSVEFARCMEGNAPTSFSGPLKCLSSANEKLGNHILGIYNTSKAAMEFIFRVQFPTFCARKYQQHSMLVSIMCSTCVVAFVGHLIFRLFQCPKTQNQILVRCLVALFVDQFFLNLRISPGIFIFVLRYLVISAECTMVAVFGDPNTICLLALSAP